MGITSRVDGQKIGGSAASDSLQYLEVEEFSQDLSVGPLNHVTSFGKIFSAQAVLLHASVGLNETVEVHWTSKTGANYTTLLDSQALGGDSDYAFLSGDKLAIPFREGDEITVTCTNAGGAGVIYGTIIVNTKA